MTAPPANSGRLPRNSLDDAVIIEAALDAVAGLGVDGLTVPAVARRLGVRPTAVYWHFRRKEDLLEALDGYALERFDSLFPPLPDGSWRDHVRAYWTEYRRILRKNPVLCELIVVRWVKSLRSAQAVNVHFRRVDGQLAVLMAAGFPPEQAARAYHTLSTYTRGCLLSERGAVVPAGDSLDHQMPDRVVANPAGLPALHAAAPYWNASLATEEDFQAGLETVLDGLACQLAARAGSR
jgi:TetR/AcrR family tetracycline transcriptional repressor